MDEMFVESVDYITGANLEELKSKVNKVIDEGEGYVDIAGSPSFINGEYVQAVKFLDEE